MSPRRRVLMMALVGLLVTSVAVFAVRVLRSEERRAGVRQDPAGPVLLVPGYGGATAQLERLAAVLRASGRAAEVVRPDDGGVGDLARQADRLRDVATARIAAGAPSVDVVGYSAGGVVVRVWASELGGDRQARRIVTLGSPHHGTDVAGLAAEFAPERCPPACRQLAPGSELLAALPDTVPGPVWTSIWTTADEVVTPPDSARLRGATNIPLQSVCAGSRTGHGELPTDPLVVSIVTSALGPGPVRPSPTSSRCAG